ncbi:MAG: hypothetical protein ACE149_14445 [Armatimonadota bacterium]
MPRRHHHHHHRDSRPRRGRSRPPQRPHVSPFDLIREDFQRMLYTMRLRTTEEAAENILMQSCEGHAQMGHGAFAGRRFPNTEMDDIVAALGRKEIVVAEQRQLLIDEVCDWADHAMNGNAPRTLVNDDGDGLIGCGLLRHIEVDSRDVLRGLYLGGMRDHSDVRREVEERTGIRIGGGTLFFVDTEVMHQLGLNGEQLAQGAYADRIEAFRQEGLIVDDPGPAKRGDRIRYMYIRERLGGGASDDAAILAAGKLYNLSVALGVFLADAIDTLEKFVVNYGDQDNDLARRIEQGFPKLGLQRDDVHRIVWLCAVPPEDKEQVPDSSLRHLLEIDKLTDQNALESHLAYVSGYSYSPLLLGSEDVPNGEFYEWFEGRLKECPI